jgi:hypothetical protein
VAASRRQGAAGELAGATGRASAKGVGGGAQPSCGAAWRRWRMLRAVAFNGDEAALVMDDIDGVALQCRGRREKVRVESIWMERERIVVLFDNGGRQQCSGGNQRGGGVFGGRSRRGGHVGGEEGGELKLGRGMEWSEASVASSIRRARGGEREREMGGRSARCRVEEGIWEREGGPGRDGRQRGAKDVAGNSPQPSSAGGGAVSQTGESCGSWATRRD